MPRTLLAKREPPAQQGQWEPRALAERKSWARPAAEPASEREERVAVAALPWERRGREGFLRVSSVALAHQVTAWVALRAARAPMQASMRGPESVETMVAVRSA